MQIVEDQKHSDDVSPARDAPIAVLWLTLCVNVICGKTLAKLCLKNDTKSEPAVFYAHCKVTTRQLQLMSERFIFPFLTTEQC